MNNIRILLVFIIALLGVTNLYAKQKKGGHEVMTCTIVHETNVLADEISIMQESMTNIDQLETKGLFSNVIGASSNFVCSSLVSLISKGIEKQQKKYNVEWKVGARKDYFYEKPSHLGYMDMSTMRFKGFKVVRALPSQINENMIDTAFYISCSIDPNKVENLIKNSTFGLLIDTLRIDLTKTKALLPKKDDKDFTIDINARITASWATQAGVYFQDEELGSFTKTFKIPNEDFEKGVFLVEGGEMIGQSFIIPRSYCGQQKGGRDCWGQGEYTVEVTIKEHSEDKVRDVVLQYLNAASKGALSGAQEVINQQSKKITY